MRVDLNLATHPFGHRRLFWGTCGVAGVLLAVLAGLLVNQYARNRERSPAMVGRETQLRDEMARLVGAETEARRVLQDPANAPVLERSQFLNLLLHRKGIAWTRTFADLEKIMPPRVLVISIRPQVTEDNDVRLEMQVGAETQRDYIEFLKALESSTLFGPALTSGYSPPNENQPLYRYLLSVNYDQQL